jgi:hypothetical protein
MEFLDQAGLDIMGAIGALVIAAIAHVIIVRRLTTTLFDPVCYVAFAGIFAIGITTILAPLALIVQIWLAFAAFWLGVLLVAPRLGGPRLGGLAGRGGGRAPVPPTAEQLLLLRMVVGLSAVVIIAANLLLWVRVGVPAFSDNPTLAKGELYEGGFGFVRRLNWGLGIFSLFGSFLIFFHSPRSFWPGALWALFLAGLMLVAALGGGKGSLLPALYVIGLLTAHQGAAIGGARLRSARSLLLALAPLALAAALAILWIEAGSLGGAAQKLVIRLFYFGDVMLYWGDDDLRREITSRYSASGYPAHLFNSLLGMFRIVDYQVPIGNEMVNYTLGVGDELAAALGPNTPFYVMGQLFFGSFGGLIYAFSVGLIFGAIRRVFIAASFRRPLHFCIWGTIVILSVALPTEDALFIGVLSDFLLPLAVLVLLCVALVRAAAVGSRDAVPQRHGSVAGMAE